jgi:hypothetical protein
MAGCWVLTWAAVISQFGGGAGAQPALPVSDILTVTPRAQLMNDHNSILAMFTIRRSTAVLGSSMPTMAGRVSWPILSMGFTCMTDGIGTLSDGMRRFG